MERFICNEEPENFIPLPGSKKFRSGGYRLTRLPALFLIKVSEFVFLERFRKGKEGLIQKRPNS